MSKIKITDYFYIYINTRFRDAKSMRNGSGRVGSGLGRGDGSAANPFVRTCNRPREFIVRSSISSAVSQPSQTSNVTVKIIRHSEPFLYLRSHALF